MGQHQECEEPAKEPNKESNAECLRRNRCKYGGECRRTAPEHRRAFSHPGDPDWERDGEKLPEVCETARQLDQEETSQQDSKVGKGSNVSKESEGSKEGNRSKDSKENKESRESNALFPQRGRCKYGADCRRQTPEHYRDFIHSGDPECTETLPVPRRPCCRYGAGCYRKGSDHRSMFAHPDDADWDEPPEVCKSSGANRRVVDEKNA